jgi:hypothetical protein
MVVGEKAALIAAGLWMTYPFNLWLTKQPNSEIPFFPLLYGALFLFGGILWRDWRQPRVALAVGVLIGWAALVRPIALGIGMLLAGLLLALRWKDNRKQWSILAVCLLMGNIVVLTPWEVWARQHTGRWIPLSTGGPVSIRDGLTCFIVTKGYRHPLRIPSKMQQVVEAALQRWEEGTLETMGEIFRFIGIQLQENPIGVFQLIVWKAIRAWYGGTDAQWPEERWIGLIQVIYLSMALGGIWFLWKQGGKAREWVRFTVLFVAYFWGMTITVLSILRYMVPVMGLLFPTSAKWILGIRRIKMKGQEKPR